MVADAPTKKSNSSDKNINDRKSKSFFVPVKEIIENNYDLSINRYKEIVYENVNYEKPENILNKINNLEQEIRNELKNLKNIL
jgi:type I restriction enzyme M protein